MPQWDHGYVTDIAYTANAHQETTPSWLAACSLLLGYRPPDLTGPFHFADLGCGNGFNTLVVAAVNPKAEVWGFDFNPTHIENARMLAAQARLNNARFEEVSFEALANGVDAMSASFDFVVAHGVLSWISAENRRHLTRIVGRFLRPGGLAYISYNTATGWAGIEPARRLMRQLAETNHRRTDRSVEEIFQVLDRLRDGGAAVWHPLMFADVAEAMSETKAIYIGSATPMENIDAAAVPANIQPLLTSMGDAGVRETIRDLASAKTFRRDLWRKGGEPLPAPEQTALLDAMTLISTGKATGGAIAFSGPVGEVTGQEEFYRPLVDALSRGNATFGELRALPELRGRAAGEFVQAALLLMGGGYAHPSWPTGILQPTRESAARLNTAIIARLRLGVDQQRLAAPVTGSSVTVGVLEGLAIGQLMDGSAHDPEALIDAVYGDTIRSGRTLLRDGQPLPDEAEARALIGRAVRETLADKLPSLRRCGILD
jgi:SAM-dependent methyltransferase